MSDTDDEIKESDWLLRSWLMTQVRSVETADELAIIGNLIKRDDKERWRYKSDEPFMETLRGEFGKRAKELKEVSNG